MRINRLGPGLQNAPELCTFNDNRMNAEVTMEERLWDYIDGLSSPGETSAISALIAASQEWQRKHKELLDMHQLMAGTDLEAPSMRFTKNVMEEIARYKVAPATKTYINKNVIRSIGAFFLLMIGGVLIYFLGQMHWTGSSPAPQVNQFSQTVQNNLNKFNWSKIFNGTYMNIFMMINVILALVLVDMYLQRKRQQAGHTPR